MVRRFTDARRLQHLYVQRVLATAARRGVSPQLTRHLSAWMWFVKNILCDDEIRTEEQIEDVLRHQVRPTRAGSSRQGASAAIDVRVLKSLVKYFFATILDEENDVPFSIQLEDNGQFRVLSNVDHSQWDRLELYLVGHLFPVTQDEYNRLLQLGYYSCYMNGRNYYIMYGPLALVNHHCRSPYHFSLPRQYQFPQMGCNAADYNYLLRHVPRNPRQLTYHANPNHAPNLGSSWLCVQIRYMPQNGDDRQLRLRPNVEIRVRYNDDPASLPFNCMCSFCATHGVSSSSGAHVVGSGEGKATGSRRRGKSYFFTNV